MPTAERRDDIRLRSRLRPGKLLSVDGAYLADCAIIERSAAGARIRLFEAVELSGDMTLFDESETLSRSVQLVWSAKGQVGLHYTSPAIPVDPVDVERIAGRYYAVNS